MQIVGSKKITLLILLLILVLLLSACGSKLTNEETLDHQESLNEQTSDPSEGEQNNPLDEFNILRGEYFDFAIANRLDYIPVFEEGNAPSSSTDYLFYAFSLNLDNWGEEKGTMTREYVEEVIRTHFKVEDITHSPMNRVWNYDGEKYIAVPGGIKDKPIYVLQELNTHIQDDKTVYEITLDDCNYRNQRIEDEDLVNIRASIVSGDLSDLKVIRTDHFQYYLDENDAAVFLSHTVLVDYNLLEALEAQKKRNDPQDELNALRGEYFDFAIANRLDYIPLFDEGNAPSSSTSYLLYAFAINLDNLGEEKGTMTREYVEEVTRSHFKVENITHLPMRGVWKYDGEKYTAIPGKINEKPIYVLQELNTHIQDDRTVYEITLDLCSFHGGIPKDVDYYINIRNFIISGVLEDLTVLETEHFQYYLDENGVAVFLSHSDQ